ncbi:MAG: ABC transporter ATP-binding protein [Ectothiorhodospiraceae bacterium]|nr:ABC transporter ATP-binding protein [Ectothiorhodospiraceae bacterium]
MSSEADVAIRIRGLGKRYRLGASRPSLAELAAQALGRAAADTLWALRDLDLDVAEGEVLGVIGRNGAGKTTLLKLLARITAPTAGRVVLRGRVASLLEVGTGFHPELSGRENVYLNGAILGLRRSEIRARFDDIVAFAEVERFLDTPVKRYSRGMFMRLAFAVAAHLDTEVLLVDEVLAVGDQRFQDRCTGRLREVAASGRTVLFVSHHMPVTERLCHRCVLLEGGRAVAVGPSPEVIARYAGAGLDTAHQWRCDDTTATGDAPARLRAVTLAADGHSPAGLVTSASRIALAIACEVRRETPALRLTVTVRDDRGEPVFLTAPIDAGAPEPTRQGHHAYHLELPVALLMPKRYTVDVALLVPRGWAEIREQVLRLDVQPAPSLANLGELLRPGVVQIQCRWSHRHRDPSDTGEEGG